MSFYYGMTKIYFYAVKTYHSTLTYVKSYETNSLQSSGCCGPYDIRNDINQIWKHLRQVNILIYMLNV